MNGSTALTGLLKMQGISSSSLPFRPSSFDLPPISFTKRPGVSSYEASPQRLCRLNPTVIKSSRPNTMSLMNTPATLAGATIIQLTVGERDFTIRVDTLTSHSSYFRAFFSGAWASEARPDGSYFLDLDGDAFAEVLHFMRTGFYPFFYSADKGFDVMRYSRVECVADYLDVSDLVIWIRTQKYLKAVGKYRTREILVIDASHTARYSQTYSANVSTTSHTEIFAQLGFICPRNQHSDWNEISACAGRCMNDALRRGEKTMSRQWMLARTTDIREETKLNLDVCRGSDP